MAAIVRRSRRNWIMGLVLALVGTLFIFAPVSPASAAGLTKGPGFMISGFWFGVYDSAGRALVCVDGGKPPASPTKFTVTGGMTGKTTAQIAKLAYVNYNFTRLTDPGQVNAKNNVYAAAVRMAALSVTGSGAFVNAHKAQLPAGVVTLGNAMIASANSFAGPYNLRVTITKQVLIGQVGFASIKVIAASGKALPAVSSSVSATNAKSAATTVKSNSLGMATVAFTRTGTGPVTIKATAKVASTNILFGVPPSAAFQRLTSWIPAIVSGSATYQKSPNQPTVSYACDTQCDGVPPVTLTTCNASGATTKFLLFDNGVITATLQLNPGICGSKTVKVADTHKVTSGFSSLVGTTWTPTVKFATTLVVDCPSLPQLTNHGVCNCVKGTLTLSIPASTHPQRIVLNGVVTEGAAGQPISVTTEFTRNQPQTFSMQTAVQRTSGVWNTSGSTVTTYPAVTNN